MHMIAKDRNMMTEPEIPDGFFDEQGRHYVTLQEGETLAAHRPAWLNGRFVVCMHEQYSGCGETVDFARFVMSFRNVYRRRPAFESQYNRWPVVFNSKKAATEMLSEALPQFEDWVGTRIDFKDPFKSTMRSRWGGSDEWFPMFTLNNAATYRVESLRDVQRRLRDKFAQKTHHADGESNGGYERRPADPNRSPRKAMKDVRDIEPVRYVLQDTVTERFVSIPPSGVRNAVLVADVDDSTCFDTIDVLLNVGRSFDQSFFNPEFSKWRLKSVGVHVKDGRFTGFADIPYAMTHGTEGNQR